ncbi:MAG TPA: hypothetical protein PKD09_09250 [Aggregatilinea sp.]|uniref:hypothetical protein n=1 Tax=Aggregatilinea sp. TaxID=2806333 RepID=UPI002D1741FD|nr:hypothetical protein [Aggregatilinea sp.]HML21822.1 hypothetical protein [Aggregatilinea sp.]
MMPGWDSWPSRLWRYFHYDLYYFNDVFTQLEAYAREHVTTDDLYKYTRGIYNPFFRLVAITAAKCYGGALDWEDLSSGAVPLLGLDTYTEGAIRQLWKDSNFGQLKMRYARQSARYGDGILKVVDVPHKQQVRLEVLHPGVLVDADIDAVGYAKSAVIEYERVDPLGNSTDPLRPDLCIYREVWKDGEVATYRVKNEQAELFGWQKDGDGNAIAQWDNPYGFVPIALAQAADIGRPWGAVTCHGGALRKIDYLNDLASLTHDHMRQAVDLMWYLAGADGPEDLHVADVAVDEDTGDVEELSDKERHEERSTVPIMYGPEGSQPHPMIGNVDFNGALEAVKGMLQEIENDCPELMFYRLADYQLNSSPAVRTVLGPALDRLTEFNSNMDAPLLRAFQMAISIGGLGHYPGYEHFGLDDYDKGNLDFQIKPREIVLDDLSKKERLELLSTTDAPPRWIWQELGISEAEIAKAEAERENQARETAGGVANMLALLKSGQQPRGDEDEDEQDEDVNEAQEAAVG